MWIKQPTLSKPLSLLTIAPGTDGDREGSWCHHGVNEARSHKKHSMEPCLSPPTFLEMASQVGVGEGQGIGCLCIYKIQRRVHHYSQPPASPTGHVHPGVCYADVTAG